jgi:hypothetical protein
MAYPVQIILGQNSIMTTAHDVQYPQKRGDVKPDQWDPQPSPLDNLISNGNKDINKR